VNTADESAFTIHLETWPCVIKGTRRSRHPGGKLLGRTGLGNKRTVVDIRIVVFGGMGLAIDLAGL
jgi:hypothetical protein